MYHLAAFSYWPIWLVFRAFGYSYTGMAIGATFALACMRAIWWFEFKE